MDAQKSDSATPTPTPKPVPTRRSEALEAELAMLEAMLPPDAEGPSPPAPVEPPTDRGGPR